MKQRQRRERKEGNENLIYRKRTKLSLLLLQTLAAFALTYCLLNIGFWMEDSYSLREMSKSYEQTELFFRQVEKILRNKITGQKNEEFFEVDGEFSPGQEIDIQSYGKGGSGVKDLNTTYLLSDLLKFCESGDRNRLHEAVDLASRAPGHQEAGETLEQQAESLETIRPVTGISLAECSRWYSDPAGFVLDMYTRLDQVCEEIYRNYQIYTNQQDESWSKEAPGNLRYCVLNTATGALYTNLPARSFEEAAEQVGRDRELTALYEGERSFDIMVTNPDNVLNEAAAKWFQEKRFVNTNERVLLAVDLSYPVSDELKVYAEYFADRELIVWISVAVSVVSAAVLLACFVLSILGTGWQEGRLAPRLYWLDRIPTELFCGLYLIIAVLVLAGWQANRPEPENIFDPERVFWALAGAGLWMIVLSACSSFVRRLRAHLLWHNSICRMLLHTWRKVTAARAASGQLLVLYVIFFILNFVLLVFFGRVGITVILVLDMVVLLYLLRDMAGKQSIWEGIHQIAKGDLAYRIDATTLTGEALEMAKAVNEMGDGLQEAVETMVKNERLKAELITNVSHDLKTPLTSIVNYVDLLKRENLQGEQVRHYIEVLDQKSQRLRQLTEDLVEASKLSSGNVELQLMRIQLQSMLGQACGEFEERLEEKGLSFAWELQREPIYMMADGRQFWRILENLLGNICKYAKEDTKVRVGAHLAEEQAEVYLENITRERLEIPAEELLGRFVRGDRSRNTEGSGLGLSIAQSLTELHGGSFRLSLDEDRFRVTLRFPVVE